MRLRQDNGVIMSFLAMLGAESWAISTLRDWLGLGSSLEIRKPCMALQRTRFLDMHLNTHKKLRNRLN